MLGIIIGLVLLMFLAYRGYSIIWVAPLCALVVALTGKLELLPAYKDTYMTGFVGFTKSWFPVFMLGAIFGHLMDYTGAARSIAQWLTKVFGAKRAILGVVIGCAVLTYGEMCIRDRCVIAHWSRDLAPKISGTQIRYRSCGISVN